MSTTRARYISRGINFPDEWITDPLELLFARGLPSIDGHGNFHDPEFSIARPLCREHDYGREVTTVTSSTFNVLSYGIPTPATPMEYRPPMFKRFVSPLTLLFDVWAVPE